MTNTRTNRVYFRDADARVETPIESAQGLRRTDTISNVEVVDPGTPQANGQTRRLIAEYEPGTYSIETITSGRVRLYRFEGPDNQLEQGAISGINHPVQGANQQKGPQTTATSDAIQTMQQKNKTMWQKNAPAPQPLKPGTKHAV